MTEVSLCTGLLERAGAVLLVASQYPNQTRALWGLPGGRPRPGELLREALVREFTEETSLEISVGRLLYVSESFDRGSGMHVTNVTFRVSADGTPRCGNDAHVVDLAWVPREQLKERIAVRVVREPLLAALHGDGPAYYGFEDAGIAIVFADEP